MLSRISFVDVISSIRDTLIKNVSGLNIFDITPQNAQPPFAYIEYSETNPISSKTMFLDEHIVVIHLVSAQSHSRKEIYEIIKDVSEALTEEIVLKDPFFSIVEQRETGLQNIYLDENKYFNAVLGFSFIISSGLKTKN